MALRKLAEGGEAWAVAIFCVGEFLRVVSHDRLCDPPTPIREALAAIESLLASPSSRLLVPGDRYLPLLHTLIEDGRSVATWCTTRRSRPCAWSTERRRCSPKTVTSPGSGAWASSPWPRSHDAEKTFRAVNREPAVCPADCSPTRRGWEPGSGFVGRPAPPVPHQPRATRSRSVSRTSVIGSDSRRAAASVQRNTGPSSGRSGIRPCEPRTIEASVPITFIR